MFHVGAFIQGLASITTVQGHAIEVFSIGISVLPNEVRCFAVMPLFYAAKHISGAALKTKAIILLDAIEKELGYHTQASIRILQQQLDAQFRM
ncbi:MAG: hypothetical protein GOMPHAMPRED_003387 [Gomphillus americanus]|uniref:Uncharacterized protein n=1 Tax=Gomphillus americanus TaxID=1940652 RepID=A0A8H3EIG8_9LECA|nr:MAG: hypothetical protein GOMPHAMPRED_003387 [Gomphillus americanus]